MEYFNRIELKGVIGKVSVTPVGDTGVVRFSVATETSYNGKDGGIVIDTTWHSVTAWRKKGNDNKIVDFSELQKGRNVHVVGRLRSTKYMDSSGAERTFYDVYAYEVSIIS